MKRRLIINADDFGLSESVNAAVERLHAKSNLTSATLLANAPETIGAVEIALQNPSLGVGLHFNLTLGSPVSTDHGSGCLVDPDGIFLSRRDLAIAILAGRVDATAIRHELESQFSRVTSLGIKPTHIDGHQHIQAIPLIWDTIGSFCRDNGLPLRTPFSRTSNSSGLRVGRRIRQLILKAMLVRNKRSTGSDLRTNSDLVSIFDMGATTGQLNLSHYELLLKASNGPVVELMIHPATNAESQIGLTNITEISAMEYSVLMELDLKRLSKSLNYELATYATAWD